MRMLFSVLLASFAVKSSYSADLTSYLRSTVCNDNHLPAYYLVQDGAFFYPMGNAAFMGIKESECLGLCSDNKHPETKSRLLCGSVTYDERKRNCTMSRFQAMPNGPGKVEIQDRSRYYEKFCIPKKAPVGCSDSLFYRHSQAVLVGFAYSYEEKESLSDCVNSCIMDQACKSVMYYYEDMQCILNSDSGHNHPEFFYEEKKDMVVYVENGCAEDNLAVQKSDKMESTLRSKEPMKGMKMSEKSMSKETMDKDDMMKMDSKEKEMMEKDMNMMLSDWSDWGPCDNDNYTRERTRKCVKGTCDAAALSDVETCMHLKGWSAWSEPCQKFTFKVSEPCLGFKVRVCLDNKEWCQGPHFKYCFMC